MSLASIVRPLVFSNVYFVVRQQWPDAIWLSALVINAIAAPIVLSLRFDSAVNISQGQD
jgi:DHA1 family tetracycline resistance protein-like MFS transporter